MQDETELIKLRERVADNLIYTMHRRRSAPLVSIMRHEWYENDNDIIIRPVLYGSVESRVGQVTVKLHQSHKRINKQTGEETNRQTPGIEFGAF